MVEIFSKRDGPRREDVQIKRLLEQNRGVITKLADQLSNGRYSQSQKPRELPQAQGLIIHIGGQPAAKPEPIPKVRITPNGRVIAVDETSGRQLQHFGDIRETPAGKAFVLAIASNRYIAPLDEATSDALADMDGVTIGISYGEDEFAADIGRRLDMASES
ncbi:MAG: hypothetical protein KGI75_08355 [Rhizobiaceae bacterium]|nr:hypothetical protein [Rhizobiaceae bacterium]